MDKLLTIAIPTFNRAKRFDKSLNDLLFQINKTENKKYISVFISNNGSTDTTADVIARYSTIFSQNDIPFSSHTFENNKGFDANVFNCYKKSDSEYVWFLADDDNIIDNSIDSIINDIQKYNPNVLNFNFDQPPYTLNNPLNTSTSLFINVDKDNIQSISKIIEWPKLATLVIRRNNGQSGEKVEHLYSSFMHVALAIQTALDYGRVLHSENFIARPDTDYMDHINFPPYIFNALVMTVEIVLRENNKYDLCKYLKLEKVDPLTSSLFTLESFYMGKFVLTPELKAILYSTVFDEMKRLKINKISMSLFKRIVKLYISYLYNLGSIILTGKRATKLRH